MKQLLYHFLFRVLDVLANLSNGASFFVKYKLWIGTLLIGFTHTSCFLKPFRVCYAPLPLDPNQNQSTDTVLQSEIPDSTIAIPSCYIQPWDPTLENESLKSNYPDTLPNETTITFD